MINEKIIKLNKNFEKDKKYYLSSNIISKKEFKEKIELNEIYNTNCIYLIDEMINQNIEVESIITDPPYNISRENNFKTIGRAGIDFGEWDWNFNQLDWIKKIKKIIKPGGSVIIFNDWKNMGDIALELKKQGFEIKDLIRWVKPAPMPRNTNRRYVNDAEYAIWVVKPGGKWTFNKPKDKPYLRPEINGGITQGKNKIHPTQKSKKAIISLIEIHTNPGDIIFDPFSGSGEISLNANEMGRLYIGSEIDQVYWKKSRTRIKNNLVKPAINHLGNKFRMINKLHSHLQIHGIKNFVDVFAGSCVVSASFKNAEKYFINDNDKNLYKILNFLINTNKKTISIEINKIVEKYSLNKLPYNEGYLKLREKYNKENKKDVRELLTLVLFGFNQQIRFNSKEKFNTPPGKTQWTEYQKEKIFKFVEAFEGKNVEIHDKDFETFVYDVISQTEKDETIYYFDPPYLITNATYNNNWNEESEKRLINLLQDLSDKKIKWILSNVLESKGNVNKILLDFIEKNNLKTIDIDLNYKNSNYQRKNYKGKEREVILKNFK